jgi:hypothetical protein
VPLNIITITLLEYRICVSALCSGTGFPVEWISATPGDKYWFLSARLRREYQNKYKFIDINNKEGTVYGKLCISYFKNREQLF